MRFVINGGKPLKGVIAINGMKNGGLPLIAAALTVGNTTTLENIPDISDIRRTIELCMQMGAQCSFHDNTLIINSSQLSGSTLDREIAKRMRASVIMTAPLLARTGAVEFPHPGGCVIGERPIDLSLEGYKAFGATVTEHESYYRIELKRPQAAKYVFTVVSVTATESLMMLATRAHGITRLINTACEPEVAMLADFLNANGARITGAGTPFITIEGTPDFGGRVMTYRNIPDRIEAGSMILAAIATCGDVTVTNVEPSHLETLLTIVRRMGVHLDVSGNSIRVLPTENLFATSVKTHEYPGFPTDLQPPLAIAMTQASGRSLLHETVFEGRMQWTEDLKRMGANILVMDPFRIALEGPSKLHGREVESPDIRAGMAYVIAGLVAEGTTITDHVELIDRGYERIEERLRALGANITRSD